MAFIYFWKSGQPITRVCGDLKSRTNKHDLNLQHLFWWDSLDCGFAKQTHYPYSANFTASQLPFPCRTSSNQTIWLLCWGVKTLTSQGAKGIPSHQRPPELCIVKHISLPKPFGAPHLPFSSDSFFHQRVNKASERVLAAGPAGPFGASETCPTSYHSGWTTSSPRGWTNPPERRVQRPKPGAAHRSDEVALKRTGPVPTTRCLVPLKCMLDWLPS